MNKDTKRKNTLTICGLSILCIVGLAVAFLLTRKPQTEFVPAAVETSTQTDSWKEKTAPEAESAAESSSLSNNIEGTQTDNTQKIFLKMRPPLPLLYPTQKPGKSQPKKCLQKNPSPLRIPPIRKNRRNMIPTYLKRRPPLPHRKIMQTPVLLLQQTIIHLTTAKFMILFLAG